MTEEEIRERLDILNNRELARRAGVHNQTIVKFKQGGGMRESNRKKITDILKWIGKCPNSD